MMLAARIVRVPVGVRHHHGIPRSVVRDDVDDDLEVALVRFGDEPMQVFGRAVGRIDAVEIAHRIGAAERALALELAEWMDRHQPQDVHAELLQAIELRGDAGEIAAGRKRARKNFVDDAVVQPGGRAARSLLRVVARGLVERRDVGRGAERCEQRDASQQGKSNASRISVHVIPRTPSRTVNIVRALPRARMNTYARMRERSLQQVSSSASERWNGREQEQAS